jgi:hypothetical protein
MGADGADVDEAAGDPHDTILDPKKETKWQP